MISRKDIGVLFYEVPAFWFGVFVSVLRTVMFLPCVIIEHEVNYLSAATTAVCDRIPTFSTDDL